MKNKKKFINLFICMIFALGSFAFSDEKKYSEVFKNMKSMSFNYKYYHKEKDSVVSWSEPVSDDVKNTVLSFYNFSEKVSRRMRVEAAVSNKNYSLIRFYIDSKGAPGGLGLSVYEEEIGRRKCLGLSKDFIDSCRSKKSRKIAYALVDSLNKKIYFLPEYFVLPNKTLSILSKNDFGGQEKN